MKKSFILELGGFPIIRLSKTGINFLGGYHFRKSYFIISLLYFGCKSRGKVIELGKLRTHSPNLDDGSTI